MPAEMEITNERLAKIATQGVSAQGWEMRAIAAELLSYRVLTQPAVSRLAPPVEPKQEV